MKKFTLSAIFAAMAILPMAADVTTVTELYNKDESFNVTWDTPLTFEASSFNEVTEGDYINIEFSKATDVVELKTGSEWGTMLPGSIYKNYGESTLENETFKCYITPAALKYLQESGLMITGKDLTVSSVSVCNDGFQMPQGAVWGGYFWVDNWNTLEIRKSAFEAYDGERYMYIIKTTEGDNTYSGYIINVLTGWDNADLVVANADKGNEIKTPMETIVDLKGINLVQMLSSVDCLMIQGNKEDGKAFNLTAVYFRNDLPTGVETVDLLSPTTTSSVYSLQGVLLRSGDTSLEGLPAGLYIVNGKKVIKR